MAVTIVSSPSASPNLITASLPQVFKLSSTVYGGAGITQFRYIVEVVGVSALCSKYTVPVDGTSSYGYVDISELLKTLIRLGPFEYGGDDLANDAITQRTQPRQQNEPVIWAFNIQVKEQYYNSGVFTTNTGSTVSLLVARGWTDLTNNIWSYVNWLDISADYGKGAMTYSGHGFQMLAIRSANASWTALATHPYISIFTTKNGGTIVGTTFFLRDTTGYENVVYFPLRVPGHTDQDDFESLKIEVYTSPVTTPAGGTLVATYEIEKTVERCDQERLVMFQDRFFQWSFLSFELNDFTSVETRPQSAELLTGRRRYNVRSSDLVTLNTNWLPDETNDLIHDLITSEQVYFVDADDGALEEVTVVPNSLRLQTSKVEGLHQYQIQFRKSLDNFRP